MGSSLLILRQRATLRPTLHEVGHSLFGGSMRRVKRMYLSRSAREAIAWLDYLASKPWLRAVTKAFVYGERFGYWHKKLTVAERIRFKYWLYWKYGGECGYCHRVLDWRYGLTIDHLQPLSKGGAPRDIRNMVLACRACNQSKGDQWE